ncbi:MAG: PadR family transcriptional regulator [Desulfomonile sp.]|nr:PadR family transcriptional regulator [Desulfomonile sp.]
MKRAHSIHNVNNHTVNGSRDPLDRNQADFPVLGMLSLGPAHGYEICSDLRDRLGGTWRLRTSHIYAVLARLEADGLVVHERVGQETRPAKKVFSLTSAGRELFFQWLRSPVKGVRQLRLEFLAKLHFAEAQPNGTAAHLVKEQEAVFEANADRLKERINRVRSPTDRLALGFRLAMLDAAVTWLTALYERAESVKPPGLF